jgi:hypothetical protein
MKSREIKNEIKGLENQGDLISDELQDIFKEIHNNKIYPPYDINLPIIQKMRSLESQLDNIDKEVDRLKKEIWIVRKSESEEVNSLMQGLVDNAIEINEDGLNKHYITSPKDFSEIVFKDCFMVSFFDYHKLLAKKYHYHVTFNNLDGTYDYNKSFYTNETLDKLLEHYKDTMGFTYITDCTVEDFSEIKEYEMQNLNLNGDIITDIFHKYKDKDNNNEVIYNYKKDNIHSAHFRDNDTFISYQSYFIAIGSYQYIYEDNCIQQFKFTTANISKDIFKSDTENTNRLKKNLDKMLNKKYLSRFDEVNQLLKDYYHI